MQEKCDFEPYFMPFCCPPVSGDVKAAGSPFVIPNFPFVVPERLCIKRHIGSIFFGGTTIFISFYPTGFDSIGNNAGSYFRLVLR